MIRVKLVNEDAAPDDGACYLVNRFGPGAMKKTDLPMDGWLKGGAERGLALLVRT